MILRTQSNVYLSSPSYLDKTAFIASVKQQAKELKQEIPLYMSNPVVYNKKEIDN